MPAGNHHYTPSGFWYQNPSGSTIPRLVFRSVRSVAFLGLVIVSINAYKALQVDYTYTNFIGKTMTYGKVSQYTHEPASAETIDKLKAENAAKKKLRSD
jgi:hypothetical protein